MPPVAGGGDGDSFQRVCHQLTGRLAGELRTDRLARTLYATDASIYQIIPDGVVFPRNVDDVVTTVVACNEHSVPLTARGAGTGLTGAAVNRGLQMDLSRHLGRILEIDPQRRRARVEPGVVLDELNAELRRHSLQFAPDVATSSRATIGGMIANNSCGARSVIYGRTVDHVISLDVVLSDGSRVTWGRDAPPPEAPLARNVETALRGVLTECRDDIAARYPKILRSNGGYGLDRLRENGRLNVEALLCGSEGTLAVIVGATLNLEPLPRHRGLCVVHYHDLLGALGSVPAILRHAPAAVELLDHFILGATRGHPHYDHMRWFLEGDPDAILIVELFGQTTEELDARLAALRDDLRGQQVGYAWPVIREPARQADVWEVRKGGTGLLMSRPGDAQPYDFVEDSAVDPARLRDYIARFQEILRGEGVDEAGYYAHASVGCLHIRPVLNLKQQRDVDRMRRIADRVSSLAIEFGGTMTGEHGDGLVRSEWLGKLYGPRLLDAFRRIKQTFDPRGILNPGKIVDPPRMDVNLRQGAELKSQMPLTVLDFSTHGGMAGLAGMCSGLGHCRQRLVGTMCPSYMATGNERDTTRARANALRAALSNKSLLDGLSDPALDEVMDLCLSCKACRTECPTGVDMARLKAEWLHHRHQRVGVPARSRLVAATPTLAAWAARVAPLANWLMQSTPSRWLLELLYGLDRRVPPPRFASPTFRDWWERRGSRGDDAAKPSRQGGEPVVFFVDTWTNFHEPGVGRAVVRVLDALGCDVIVPPTVCCGRPALSKGLLTDAQRLAERNVALLEPYAARGLPIVCAEPSCLSAMLDEWPQLVRTEGAKAIARHAVSIESFAARRLAASPGALRFAAKAPSVLYHGHCHQKALWGCGDALALLRAASGDRATEIDSGCCGMAGSFGHEKEHYDVARAVGEQRLFPAVRSRGDAQIAISGFSCRHQIAHHCDVRARHVIEFVADALG